MQNLILLLVIFFAVTRMDFKYHTWNFSFDSQLTDLKKMEASLSKFDDRTIFEQPYISAKSNSDISFRIVDFTKQGTSELQTSMKENLSKLIDGYLDDIKLTGLVDTLENPTKMDGDWIVYSAGLKLSKDDISNNLFYLKSFDQIIVVISIGSTTTTMKELKVVGEQIRSSWAIENN